MTIDYSDESILEDIQFVPSKLDLTDNEIAAIGMTLLELLPKKVETEPVWRIAGRLEGIQRLSQ